MKNSIFADIKRVGKKPSFIILLIVEVVAILCVNLLLKAAIPALQEAAKTDPSLATMPLTPEMSYYSMTVVMICGVGAFLLGLPIFMAIFSDDFRSHAMQNVIGFGLSRSKLILARFFEVVILMAFVSVIMLATAYATGLILGMDSDTIGRTCQESMIGLIPVLCYLAICIIFVYGTQSTTLSMIMYILFILGIPGKLFDVIRNSIPGMKDIHIEWILPDRLMSDVALSDTYSWGWVAWIIIPVVFIALPVWVATVLFKKKELEF